MEQKITRSHVLVFPYPAQGHINPMLQFSKRLASKGLRVSLIVATNSLKSMQNPPRSVNIEVIDFQEGEKATSLDEQIQLLEALVSQRLANLIERLSFSTHPAKVLIYDSGLTWALDVAKKAGIDGAPFFTQSWAVNAIYYHLHKGTLKVPLTGPMVELPSMPVMGIEDLPSPVCNGGAYPVLSNLFRNQFSNFLEARWLFCNTFNELEEKLITWMLSERWSLMSVGPTVPSMFLDKRLEWDREYGLNLFEPEKERCMKWLDAVDLASVAYVSFGSFATLGEQQMQEIAWGLKRSNCNFLWVVRETEKAKLPSNFEEEVAGKGLVVSWCPQMEVLAHPAVSCFVTHCGWNSTLEALSLGVPMVAVPQWTDQPTNAKLIVDVWKVGVRVEKDGNGIITRDELTRCVNEVTGGEKSLEIRKNSEKWMKLAREAVGGGGSSDKHIEEFVATISGN